MEDLYNFIDEATVFIKAKIVEIIENDDYWLEELGVLNKANDKTSNTKNLILIKLEDIENSIRTNKIIQYVLDDYVLEEDNKYSIFYGICSVDSYTRNSALYVFKFNTMFFCYYLPERSLITIDPIPFCKEAIQNEIKHFEIENENMKDEYFDEVDFSTKLNWNIIINFE